MKKPYNGHESWNAWNVSLWIGNDEGLYRRAMECITLPRADGKPITAYLAARRFAQSVPTTEKTPDGARYSFHSVKLAMSGLME